MKKQINSVLGQLMQTSEIRVRVYRRYVVVFSWREASFGFHLILLAVGLR